MTAKELACSFLKDHSDLFDRGLQFMGIYFTPSSEEAEEKEIDLDPIPGNDVIHVMRPFIFDSRKIPPNYKDFRVINILASPSEPEFENIFDRNYLPKEFVIREDEVIYWEDAYAPIRYTAFVDRCKEQIRQMLGDRTMSRMDILDALAWGSFKDLCERFRKAKHDRMNGVRRTLEDDIHVSIGCGRGRDVV